MADEKHTTLRVLDDLQMKSLDGKREYVESLKQRDDEQALSLLVECLCDESAFLRQLAERALIQKGPASAPVLLPHLTQGLWFTRASVARILGRMGARESLPGLGRMSGDENREVADAAIEALAEIAAAGHAVTVARTIYDLDRGVIERVLDRAERASPGLSGQLHRLMGDRELMTAGDEELLREDAEAAQAQDNLEWEVLTGKGSAGPGRARKKQRVAEEEPEKE